MNGYAAAARIVSASPRFVGGTAVRAELATTIAPVETEALLLTGPDDPLPAPGPNLSERWSSARERWSQLTFYLTDPNSWR